MNSEVSQLNSWAVKTALKLQELIDGNMEKVALIEREKNRSYTLLIFNFAREDSLYTMTVQETPDEIHRLAPLPER